MLSRLHQSFLDHIHAGGSTTISSAHLASYVGNDPINFGDPFGLRSCPNGDDKCIEDENSEWSDEQQPPPDETTQNNDEIVVTAQRNRRFSNNSPIHFPASGEIEQGFRVSTAGISESPFTESGTQQCADGSSRRANRISISGLGAGESIGHTHGGGDLVPLPGPEDGLVARATGRTAYVMTSSRAFAIERTSAGYRVRVIAGWNSLSSADRSAIRDTVRGYNANNGGSGQQCTFTPN